MRELRKLERAATAADDTSARSESFGEYWVPHRHAATYETQRTTSGTPRLYAGNPGSDPAHFLRLVECLPEPFTLLYVLHTTRGEGERGRYESPLLTLAEVQRFLADYDRLLRSDARFELWAWSAEADATVVWTRHDTLYGYGPLDLYIAALAAAGFQPGTPCIPDPHTHNYHPSLDAEARALLAAFDWHRTPLLPQDEQ